ncbi:MAG: glutamine-hydrolyzing carbamoyl-phosphate synthase small subunit [Planctomycetes bacterium]|nr:glutamine-hydrolyzing carbamoyl-phosphate synthase small subunit [Planctomycetota bacterium]
MTTRTAKLALEDGTIFAGRAFGADGERAGEVVFNTAMSGYQEILTDPSYKGQIVAMTYPHIGNYGVNEEDLESAQPWVEGFVAREFSRIHSNFRASATLEEYFKKNGVVGIDDIDTRALTRKLRITGAMNGVLSTTDLDDASLARKAKAVPSLVGLDLVKGVTGDRPRPWREFVKADTNGVPSPKYRVALIDCGVKWNIVRMLAQGACDVTVYPAHVGAGELLAKKVDGVVLSNGPGDPGAVTYTIETVRELIRKSVPLFGICLGHQILGLALGARVYKLKFGHHGANHPVKEVSTGRVEITSQNHGFSVDERTCAQAGIEVTHVNLNDGTVEGFRHRQEPIFSVQYHPEASPGPHDSRYLFAEFIKMMGGTRGP